MPDTLSGLKAQGLPLTRWALSPSETLALVKEIAEESDALYKKIARLEAAQSVTQLPLPRELIYANRTLGSHVYNLRMELHYSFGAPSVAFTHPDSSDPTAQVWYELARELRTS